jgi:hypothetical protein
LAIAVTRRLGRGDLEPVPAVLRDQQMP